LLEIELEDVERLPDVRRRRRDRDERQNDVALLDLVLDPLLVDRDVALEVREPRVPEERRDLFARDVQARDEPVGRMEDPLRQRVADEAVDAEDEHPHEDTACAVKCRASISFCPSRWMRRIST